MATITYNGVELKLQRTIDFAMDPVYDSTGVDLLFHRVSLAAICVWNPVTVDPSVRPAGNLGAFVKQLQFLLMEPRRALTFTIGPDSVVVLPENNIVGGVGGPAPCDVNYGPIPQTCQVQEIFGLKTALVYYKIVFHLTTCKNIVLSNRWAVQSDTDKQGFTTRVIQGRTIVRADVVANQDLTADDFRQVLLVPPPATFQRTDIKVNVSGNGTTLDWMVVDTERWLGINNQSPAAYIEGTATNGWGHSFKSWESLVGEGKGIYQDVKNVFTTTGKGGGISAILSSGKLALDIAHVIVSHVPISKPTALVRVFGRADSNKANLANIGYSIIIDRFVNLRSGGGGLGKFKLFLPTSITVTQDIMNPVVFIEAEFFHNFVGPEIGKINMDGIMNMEANIAFSEPDATNLFTIPQKIVNPANQAGPLIDNPVPNAAPNIPHLPNPALPAGANNVATSSFGAQLLGTRPAPSALIPGNNVLGVPVGRSSLQFVESTGSWVGALLTQVLNNPCRPPSLPPDNTTGVTRTALK